MAVAATTPDDKLSLLSNYGDWVDLAAPGYNIYSTLPGDNYGYKTGTSFATAYVSGLAALIYSIAIDVNGDGNISDEIRTIIESSCREVGLGMIGSGIIDAFNCLQTGINISTNALRA